MEEKYKNQLRALIQLAMSDKVFDDHEKEHIQSLAVAHNISKEIVDDLITENMKNKGEVEIQLDALSFDDRFEFLYNIVQLMKIDNEVFLSEIRYCERIAEKLGFEKKVVKSLSTMIYSDPSITAERERLKREVRNFEMD